MYIGADEFGARSAAGNTVDDIAKLCDFAHLYGCKVYVALNTILSDAEVPRAARLRKSSTRRTWTRSSFRIWDCWNTGFRLIAIHSSTQCHTTTPEKAKFLESCGFDTIVVARNFRCARSPKFQPPSNHRRAWSALCTARSAFRTADAAS